MHGDYKINTAFCIVKLINNSSLPIQQIHLAGYPTTLHHSICQRGIRTEIIEGTSINYLQTIDYSETRSTRLEAEGTVSSEKSVDDNLRVLMSLRFVRSDNQRIVEFLSYLTLVVGKMRWSTGRAKYGGMSVSWNFTKTLSLWRRGDTESAELIVDNLNVTQTGWCWHC